MAEQEDLQFRKLLNSPEQVLLSRRVDILEDKLSVVEENTHTVDRLSGKMSLLLTVLSVAIAIITSSAIYAFTSVNKFKDYYFRDILQFQERVNSIQNEDREFIRSRINDLEQTINTRMDKEFTGIRKQINSKYGLSQTNQDNDEE